jgi:tetratricopeptide (TPR) repeat protein
MWTNCPECNKKMYSSDVVCVKCGSPFYENLKTSPYKLNEIVNNLIKRLHKKYNERYEERIIELLYVISNSSMSKYQLSLTYKKFGECYFKYKKYEEALSCYENGLKLNAALPVKRKIKELQSLLLTQEIKKE